MALQELQIYALWSGKQTAKGTPLIPASITRRYKQVAGDLNIARADGSENYSDATQYTNYQDWVDTLNGTGTPGIEATPEEAAHLFWLFEGGETTTAVTGPPAKTKHTVVPLPGLGFWSTWYNRVGSSVIRRTRYNDAQINQLEVGGSTGAKAVRITPTILSLDPGEWQTADPTQAMPTKASFLYTDGTSRFTIDGTVFAGQSDFTLVANKDLQPVYGDDVTIYDLAIGNAVVTIAVTLHFDAQALQQYNKLAYGNTAPAAGAKPIKALGANGSYSFDLKARDNTGVWNGDEFVLTLAGVKWTLPDAPDPNPDGGPASITLSGQVRKAGANPAYQVDISNDAAAFTV